jgi:hypothetical protein
MASEMNPYAAPRTDVNAGAASPYATQGMFWRSGPLLMARDGTVLPARCVKCNGQVHEPLKRHRFYWHHPAFFALLLLNAIIYIIVALIVRRRAEVTFGLCPAHRRKRNQGILIGVGGVVASIALIVGGAVLNTPVLSLVAIFALVISIIVAISMGRPLLPARIDKSSAQLKGCGEAFLAGLANP